MYILECVNHSLYTGVTNDLKKRLDDHLSGQKNGAKFTRAFPPVRLAYSLSVESKSLAHRLEYWIKKLPRGKKEMIVENGFSKKNLLRFLGLDS